MRAVDLGDTRRLLLVIHHLVVDGVSCWKTWRRTTRWPPVRLPRGQSERLWAYGAAVLGEIG
ncbi:MAG: hypothetical protein U1E83_01805 [Methylotetracoccus sp.]